MKQSYKLRGAAACAIALALTLGIWTVQNAGAAAANEDSTATSKDSGQQDEKSDASKDLPSATNGDNAGNSNGKPAGNHPGRHHGKHFGKHGFGKGMDAVADALGMTKEELKSATQAGKTLKELAAAKDISIEQLVEAGLSEPKTKLAEALKAGDITQAQYDERLAEIKSRITAMVNGELPPMGAGSKRGMGGCKDDSAVPNTSGAESTTEPAVPSV